MATFLELSQKLRRECGIAGTGPAAVTGQSGLLETVVNWVNDSWRDIQVRHDNWRWMRAPFTVTTTPGDGEYAYGDCTDDRTAVAIARFSRWWANDRLNPFLCYLASSGVGTQYRMIWLRYENFVQLQRFGSQQLVTGQPIYVTVDDAENLLLGPVPDGAYTLTGFYQRGPQSLVANGDTPDMPERFHDLIVYYAMQRYAANSVAPEVLARATLEGTRILRALELSQLPVMRLGGPLA